ncbi:dihydrofolate reductase family protein [Streptomyces sp. NPDC086023]|uniref:dihydrofolate reductase family protein n=1 Tax=Streptomyces sp. NPDC086023 TaxID=3365746 RepID=UPI0037D02AA1
MRKIIMMMSVSLDGYFEGPNREIDWHRVDEELHGYFNQRLRGMGGFLSGRVTYELMADFWPDADADPDAPASVAEFAGIWRDMPKTVYSRTLERADWNTTVRREVVPAEVEELKARAGGDLVLGGADVAATFSRLGLIDAYDIYVHPVLIGRGRSPFPDTDTLTALRLADTQTFGNGVVRLSYTRA